MSSGIIAGGAQLAFLILSLNQGSVINPVARGIIKTLNHMILWWKHSVGFLFCSEVKKKIKFSVIIPLFTMLINQFSSMSCSKHQHMCSYILLLLLRLLWCYSKYPHGCCWLFQVFVQIPISQWGFPDHCPFSWNTLLWNPHYFCPLRTTQGVCLVCFVSLLSLLFH